ncbi:MAG: phenylalanine--tRNA ligase subunit alpha [Bdellovibrionota bacterium]|jgi:phenylalanyl-tRNA synthetase alpha chain
MNLNEINWEAIEGSLAEAKTKIASLEDLESLKKEWLGKDGTIKTMLKSLKDLTPEERPVVAAKLNEIKAQLEEFFSAKAEDFNKAKLAERLVSESTDMSLPVMTTGLGHISPVRLVERRIHELLSPFGVKVVEGPEVETEYYCFDALNIPKHHPARDMQDTFFTNTEHVLRTHTTSVQARELSKKELPVRVVSPGRVYRNETEDASHQSMFHQYELIWIEKGLTLAHLMGILSFVLKGLYGKRRKVRFVPKYYPYTEPSIGAQIDCGICKGSGCPACGGCGWVTILGAGMVHKVVFEEFGYDPDAVSGIAFGLGSARLAAQLCNIPTLKILYSNDLRAFSEEV